MTLISQRLETGPELSTLSAKDLVMREPCTSYIFGDPSPCPSLKNLEHLRIAEHVESVSPGKKSGVTTPKTFNSFESNPMTAEGWEALRQSLVYFKGQPVGTIAALDPSEDALNYDQVLSL